MLEYLYQMTIINLFDSGIQLSDIPEEELKKLLRINANKSVDMNEIDCMLKKNIDILTEKYGVLGSLVKLSQLDEEASCIQQKYRLTRLGDDLGLLKAAAQAFCERIENYYLPDIFYKLYIYFWKLNTNTFDDEEFFKNITHSSIDAESLLGKEDIIDQMDQISIFDTGNAGQSIPRQESLYRSYEWRINAIKEIKGRITSTYTAQEIKNYIVELVEKLTLLNTKESALIIKFMLKAGRELRSSSMTSNKKDDSKQFIIIGF